MSVHVENLTSEVIPEPESAPAASDSRVSDEVDKVRRARARLSRDRVRISAEGFDD